MARINPMASSTSTRSPIRQAVDVLLGLVLVALAAAWWRAAPNDAKAGHQQGFERTAPFDWSNVSHRDMNIAAVFVTARDRGVRAAMDSLQEIAKHDSSYWTEGDMIAHALGRDAIGANRNEPSGVSTR